VRHQAVRNASEALESHVLALRTILRDFTLNFQQIIQENDTRLWRVRVRNIATNRHVKASITAYELRDTVLE
jgi:hypothetical protein